MNLPYEREDKKLNEFGWVLKIEELRKIQTKLAELKEFHRFEADLETIEAILLLANEDELYLAERVQLVKEAENA